MNMNQKICIVPTPHGVGGMVSFYERFKKELSRRNVEIATSVKDTPYKAILVIGGSKDLRTLVDAKRKGYGSFNDRWNELDPSKEVGWV
jgi:hypothetical protein